MTYIDIFVILVAVFITVALGFVLYYPLRFFYKKNAKKQNFLTEEEKHHVAWMSVGLSITVFALCIVLALAAYFLLKRQVPCNEKDVVEKTTTPVTSDDDDDEEEEKDKTTKTVVVPPVKVVTPDKRPTVDPPKKDTTTKKPTKPTKTTDKKKEKKKVNLNRRPIPTEGTYDTGTGKT